MNEQRKNNGRGIFYGVIGVATLVVAIIGATFAYFTATGNDNGTIKGNMATITFSLNVQKVTHVDETKGGMIPMSNNMVQQAVTYTAASGEDPAKLTCVDDNGNAVCQIYKITVTNTGSASLFVDGYVALKDGSGNATDIGAKGKNLEASSIKNPTTMRWAQVFCNGNETDEITGCSTAGSSTTGASGITIATLDAQSDETGFNASNIKTTFGEVTGTGTILGNSYSVINTNYIRISNHDDTATSFDRNADPTSALVYNQNLAPSGQTGNSAVLYIVVWLTETGTNQTATATGAGTPENSGIGFFSGQVVFNSAQGSEVTATFTGYKAVPSDKASSGE